MIFTGIIERENTITVDGYSNKKTVLGAIREMGRFIEKHLNQSEGKSIVDGGKESLLQSKYSCGGYFLEVEEVPCACEWDEDKEEMTYADGKVNNARPGGYEGKWKGGEKMKPYMLVMTTNDGSRTVQFYDNYDNAVKGYNICVAIIGWNCELYAHKHLSDCDRLPVSKEIMGYVKIM